MELSIARLMYRTNTSLCIKMIVDIPTNIKSDLSLEEINAAVKNCTLAYKFCKVV